VQYKLGAQLVLDSGPLAEMLRALEGGGGERHAELLLELLLVAAQGYDGDGDGQQPACLQPDVLASLLAQVS
jgi:hypothetical protein